MNLQDKPAEEKNSIQLATWITPTIEKNFNDIAKQLARNKANLLRKLVLDFLQEKNQEEIKSENGKQI